MLTHGIIKNGNNSNHLTEPMSVDHCFQLLEHMEQPSIIEDPDTGLLCYANAEARRRFNISKRSLSERRFSDLLKPFHAHQETNVWLHRQQTYRLQEARIPKSDSKSESDTHTDSGDDAFYKQYILTPISLQTEPHLVNTAQSMAQVVVHRFRSTLNGISGFFDMLDQNLTPEAKEASKAEIDAVHSGLHTLAGQLDEIKEFSNPVNPNIRTIDLQKFFEELKAGLPTDTTRTIDWKFESQQKSIESDPKLLQEIVMILIHNAVEASEDELDDIHVEALSNAKFAVTNLGTTIPKADVNRVFQPFFTTKARHLGLGLSRGLLKARALGYQLYLRNNSKIKGVTFELNMETGR